jgi:ATP-dependent RNA helicase DDX49/DBP8
MSSDARTFPKRRKVVPEKFVFRPSTLDKLIAGIWEQLHGTFDLNPQAIFDQFQVVPANSNALCARIQDASVVGPSSVARVPDNDEFTRMNVFCRKITQASRVCRSIEIIVQARWVELFEEQIQFRIATMPLDTPTKHRKAVTVEACHDFGWSERELRNRIAVWRGYKEVKDAAGWASLVFSGMGIYRFCKYRVEFTKEAMKRLQGLRKRFEVAADTLHPNWRQVLTVVGEPSELQYTGHPHDWVVFTDGSDPATLRSTYLQHDPHFQFEQLDESVIDEEAWGCDDPRWIPQADAVIRTTGTYICAACGNQQSDDPKTNCCHCFPNVFACVNQRPSLVQVYRTPNGRNNGLLALTTFDRGAEIGEYVGLVTKDVRHLDVIHSSTENATYQIWQGRQGNITRFINHSCKPNAQFTKFTWLDTQRIVLVSKGIEAGSEIFVDYGDRYWEGLDKACLCHEACCRYRRKE